jgi:uncharacterized membrane protein YccF (DUF307 family)
MMITQNSGTLVTRRPNWLLQLLWFVFVGWWLGLAAIGVAYVMLLMVVTIPLGIMILNILPELIALRPERRVMTPYGTLNAPQYPFLLRALWFVFVGWWLAGIYLALGYLLCVTIIGLPFGFWLFDAVPWALTLRRSA